MKPLPLNQPFSSNDINYIVLLSLQHPAIKSNHGSLANLFMHEAAVSFLPCFHPPPPFFALHEHDVHSEGHNVPKPLRLKCSAQSHRAPWNAPLKHFMPIGGCRPALGPNLSQFSRHLFSSSNCPAINGHFPAVCSYSMAMNNWTMGNLQCSLTYTCKW